MYPNDGENFKNERKALSIVHYYFNPEHWIYRGEIGNDFGRDCILELTENNKCLNQKLECQVKGRSSLNLIKNESIISFPLSIKTINYAINSAYSFMLLLVDLKTEKIYYVCIQEYFFDKKIVDGQKSICVRIPIEYCLDFGDDRLQRYARKHWN